MSLVDKLGYLYLFIVFITLIVLVFGLRQEIKNNPDFVEKLTCETGVLTHYNLTDGYFIYKQNDTIYNNDNCDKIVTLLEKTNKIWLPIIVLWVLILLPDIQKLCEKIEKIDEE